MGGNLIRCFYYSLASGKDPRCTDIIQTNSNYLEPIKVLAKFNFSPVI